MNTTENLNGFILHVVKEIEESTKLFWNRMTEEERKVIKSLPPMAQRIAFFKSDDTGWGSNYHYCREALRQWILFGEVCPEWCLPDWDKKLNLITEDADDRADDIFWEYGFRYEYPTSTIVAGINATRKRLLSENPILTNDKIDISVRREMMNATLESDEWYMKDEKELTKRINKMVSTLITKYLFQ